MEKLQDLSTKDLEKFIACKTEGALAGLCGEEQDRQILLRMIEAVLDRAAKLVAIHLSSVILQTGKGKKDVYKRQKVAFSSSKIPLSMSAL